MISLSLINKQEVIETHLVQHLVTQLMATESSSATIRRLCFVGGQIGSFFIAKALISSSYIKQEYDPYPWRMNTLLKVIGIRAIRQSIFASFIAPASSDIISSTTATIIVTMNVVIDALSIYFTAKNTTKMETNLDYIAMIIFALGCVLETGHDFLKLQFKNNPDNNGKLYTSGFAKYMIFPNYCGFWLWHTGRALLSHNMYFTTIISAMQFWQFQIIGIPKATEYATKKYGQQYIDYRANTYKMIPFIY